MERLSLEQYEELPAEELERRIAAAKEQLAEDLVILGHHYQRDTVFRFADFRGDSLELSRRAAEQQRARFIVFCGVSFMGETAAVLCGDHQRVVLPNLDAGCPLADYAELGAVERAWRDLAAAGIDGVVPITYVNSDSLVKDFCGRRGGLTCTSANAEAIIGGALAEDGRVLFMPDANLGQNTARRCGLAGADVAIWSPSRPLGGHDPEALRRARMIIWSGHCCVHAHFSAAHVERARAERPGVRVIVHPECTPEVVEAADAAGSTSWILKDVAAAPAGSAFAVGTEVNLVNRLARDHPDKDVAPLHRSACSNMALVDLERVAYALDSLVAGEPVNVVRVEPEVREGARVAIRRMLERS